MIKVNIKAVIKEICFKGDRCCKFIIENENGGIYCTLSKFNMNLAEKVQEGKEYSFSGEVSVFKKVNKHNAIIVENAFYVSDIQEVI